MKKYVLLLMALVFTNLSIAQDSDEDNDSDSQDQGREILIPDYSSIEQIVKDSNSLFFYPRLLKKYENNDTTLSLREYRMLYYGYFFQDDYSTYNAYEEVDDTARALLNRGKLSKEQWQTVIRLEKKSLQNDPFELKKLNVMFIAYKKTGDSLNAGVYLDKIKKIAFTILSSGDGQSDTTGLHVLSISDEYAMVKILGYEYGGEQQLTNGQCDYLTLKDNNDNVKGLYFDVKQILKGYQKLYGDVTSGKQ